jgi:hypothetical protein
MRPLTPSTLTRVVTTGSRRDGFRSTADATMRTLLHDAAATLAQGPLELDLPVGDAVSAA